MGIIRKAQRQEVYWTLPWNVEGEANIKLRQLLGQYECHFCKNLLTFGGYAWEITGTGWRALNEASVEEHDMVLHELSNITCNVVKCLKNVFSNTMQAQSFADKIMSVPNEEYIFFRFSDGKLNVMLAAWGFKSHKNPSVILNRKRFEKKSFPVRIGFKENGNLLIKHPFSIVKQTINDLYTDEDGFFVLGDKIKVGSVFYIRCRVCDELFLLTVTEGQSDYFFEVKKKASKVLSQETVFPLITETLQESANENKKEEKDGISLVQEKPFDVKNSKSNEIDEVKILDSEDGKMIVGSEESTEENPLKNVKIQLVDKNKHSVPNAKIFLRNHKGEEFRSVTNNEGCISVPFNFFTNDKNVKVFSSVGNVKFKTCKLKYKSLCDFYIIELKESRKCTLFWLLLLLLPLLLLIRCEHDIKVTCIDKKTDKPIAGIDISLDYTAHFLYDDGRFFSSKEYSYLQYTDESGNTIFKNLECSVFSYLFYCLSKVQIIVEENKVHYGFFHFTRYVVFELENVDCAVDIVMCIDNTGSMNRLLDMVKSNATNFHSDLKEYCKEKRRNLNEIRLKVISFGDLTEKPIEESPMFVVPKETELFNAYIGNIMCKGGGDAPENGLEALTMAINTNWVQSNLRCRHIIIVYTDAPAHKLENPVTHTSYYPVDMPYDFSELSNKWNLMNDKTKRLVLFAPSCYPWNDIVSSWDEVVHKTEKLDEVLTGDGYEEILDAICKSL